MTQKTSKIIGIHYSFSKDGQEMDELLATDLSAYYANMLLESCKALIIEEVKSLGSLEDISGTVYGCVKFPVVFDYQNENGIMEERDFIAESSWVLLREDQSHLKNSFHEAIEM